jgi:BlaI family penicillinase repressor
MKGTTLSRREREIMDILYQRGKASAGDVLAAMDDAPSYSAVRAMLRKCRARRRRNRR